jgi:hypothetical protein
MSSGSVSRPGDASSADGGASTRVVDLEDLTQDGVKHVSEASLPEAPPSPRRRRARGGTRQRSITKFMNTERVKKEKLKLEDDLQGKRVHVEELEGQLEALAARADAAEKEAAKLKERLSAGPEVMSRMREEAEAGVKKERCVVIVSVSMPE